jgi:hypothetical protein
MIEAMRVSIVALKRKKAGARITGLFCVSISFTIFTPKEFAGTGLSLQKNPDEVKQLSAEKEQIITAQNETGDTPEVETKQGGGATFIVHLPLV